MQVDNSNVNRVQEAEAARAGKVEQLGEAVQSGRYRVDALKVGKAIVNASLKGAE